MTATFARCVQICLETRLVQAINSLWSDRESANRYWQAEVVPLIQRMGFTPVVASLLPACRGQTPTRALLTSLARALDCDLDVYVDGVRFDRALERLLSESWGRDESVVLFVDGLERWCGARWRSDASAFRAVAQANQHRLFVVYVCIERQMMRRLFGDVREPLYREGMSVVANDDGVLLN